MEFSIDVVTSNLEVHLDPNSDPVLRWKSRVFLERFETSSLDLENYGFYFANLFGNTIEIQYYGLHLLEVFVKTRWSDYPCENKHNFRNLILVYFADSVKQWPIQNIILKNSFAKLLTEIGKRDWIGEWPTYLEELLNIVKNGQYTHYEILLMYLLRLSEDISTHMDPIVSSRDKKLLSESLLNSHAIIFTFFCQLTEIFKEHSLIFVHFNLLNVFLLSLISFFHSASLKLILCDDLTIIHLLNNLLLVSQFRIKSIEALIVLLQRNELKEDFPPEIAFFFYTKIFETILNIIKEDNFEPDSLNEIIVQDYMFFKQVSELVSVFTVTNMDFLLTVQFEDIMQRYNSDDDDDDDDDEHIISSKSLAKILFDILDILSYHPSQHVTLLSIEPLNFLLRSSVMLDPAMKSKRHSLFENICLKLVINGDPNDTIHPACYYNNIDFSDKQEFKIFSSRYDQLVSNCICTVIKEDINFAKNFLITTFDGLIGQPFSISSLNTRSFHLSWDVLSRYIKCFFMVVDSMEGPKCIPYTMTSYISHNLLGYKSEDYQIILNIIMTLKCIVSFIRFDESNMDNFILTIVKFLQLMPENKNFTDTNLVSIRRNTLFLLQKLTRICAPIVFPWFSRLYDLFRINRMEFTIFNRALFLASLLLMIKQSDVESQIRFISVEILLHSDFVQFELFEIVSSPSISTFISFMGYGNQLQPENAYLNRSKLYNSIRILLTFFDCYSHTECFQLDKLCLHIIQGMYIPLLHLFRNCTNIRSPNYSTLLHPHINLSALCATELFSLGGQYAMIDKDSIEETHHDSTSLLLLLHEANSRLLIKCFKYNQYLYNEAIVHLICENLFEFSTTNLICVKYLVLHFLQSFIIFCPIEFYGCVLLPIIDNFVKKITYRLNEEWDLIYSHGEISNMMNTRNSNINYELVSTVSREILRFINFTFHFEPSKSYGLFSKGLFSMQELNDELKTDDNAVTRSPREFNTFFRSHLSHSQNSVIQLLKLSKHAITWKDSVCIHWVTEFSTSILHHHKFYHIDETFIKDLFFVILSEIKDQVNDPNAFHKLSVMLLAIINIGFVQSDLIIDVLYSLPNIPNVLSLDLRHAILNKDTKRQAVLIKKILMQILNQEQTD